MNKTITESVTEKEETEAVGFYRRLSRRSIKLEEDLNSNMRESIQLALGNNVSKRRPSYIPPDRIIMEENEDFSSSSSSLKSKSPTSSSNSHTESDSSYNIFGNKGESSSISEMQDSFRPIIEVNQFSSKKIMNLQGILKKNSDSSSSISKEKGNSFLSKKSSSMTTIIFSL